MSFYKLLITRFTSTVLLLVAGACSMRTAAPNSTTPTWGTPGATSPWEAMATQTSMGTPIGTRQPGTSAPGGAQATSAPGIATLPAGQITPSTGGTPQAPAGAPAGSAPATPAGAAEGQPPIVATTQNWLADQIGQPVSNVVIQNFERVEWADTCLGLDQPGVGCAQVVTPGWRIVFYADGVSYEVRADETGRNIRMIQGGKG